MSDTLLLHLPSEIVWIIADDLLRDAVDARHVIRLGLANRFLYSTLVDDDMSWLTRCRQKHGSAQTDLFARAADVRVRWMHIYVAMGRVVHKPSGWSTASDAIHGPATLIAPGAIYRGQTTRGRPTGYGVYTTRTKNLDDALLIIAEAHLSADRDCQSGWVHVRRIAATDPIGIDPHVANAHYTGRLCLCALCENGVPTFVGPLRDAIADYRGDWDAGRFHGRGRAEFADGAVYEGDWAGSVPHGHGTLNGVALRWHFGIPVQNGHCKIADAYGGEWIYEGDVTLAAPKDSDCVVSRWHRMVHDHGARALIGIIRPARVHHAIAGPMHDVSVVAPHGHGIATHTDGRVYAGSWRLGMRERGRCTLADGLTVLDGTWGVWSLGGSGTVIHGDHSPQARVLWNEKDRPCRHDRLRYRAVHQGQPPRTCPCSPDRPIPYGCYYGAGDDYVVHRNGDACGGECEHDEADTLTTMHWFGCSPWCPDPEFAGLVLFPNGGWTRARPKGRPWASAVYWPVDIESSSFARFAAYVRKGLIGWDQDMVDFFWQAMADMGVVQTDS
ncbi:Morn repeat domain containing protein [Pandoravirus neocaledonia]|uniref:Morn repeat domain containing protein n=1 Tax=Pandoravirus neocaledonia TaxID=2107708 RepID=A0A2U7UCX6_9VIRU|nr:Morn repeat domain containing protein [Pandoravirus neocaledonia]AVK76318.1 Morn repeat domain containing protein [Pandoravirus neocaledonia]